MHLGPTRRAVGGPGLTATIVNTVLQVQRVDPMLQMGHGEPACLRQELPHRLIDQRQAVQPGVEQIDLVPGRSVAVLGGRRLEFDTAIRRVDLARLVQVEEVHNYSIGRIPGCLDPSSAVTIDRKPRGYATIRP